MGKTKEKIISGLDEFTLQYLETALWSSTDNSDESGGDPLDANYSIEDFTTYSIKKAISDCAAFQEKNSDLWHEDEKSDSSAGHDFWLTRNGHGAGFWDGDYPINGDRLTDECKQYGELHIDVYNGYLHFA